MRALFRRPPPHQRLAERVLRAAAVVPLLPEDPPPHSRFSPHGVTGALWFDTTAAVVLGAEVIIVRGGTIDDRTVTEAERITWLGTSAPAFGDGRVAVAAPGGLTFHRHPRAGRRVLPDEGTPPPGLAGCTLESPVEGTVVHVVGSESAIALQLADGAVVALREPRVDDGEGPAVLRCRRPVVVDRPGREVEVHEVDQILLRQDGA